jgi:hypothetical protein
MAKLAERITVDPEQCGGRPCICGMRIRVINVLDLEGVLAVVVPCHCERREAIFALIFPALRDCFVAFGSSQ